MKLVKPRQIFLLYFSMVVVFIAAATGVRGNAGIAMLTLVLFFESICFPTIFTLGIRGLGRKTKTGATVIVGCVSGGAVIPPILGVTADALNDTGHAMLVPLCFFLVGYVFPLWVNLHPRSRQLMDDFHESGVGMAPKEGDVEKASVEEEKGGVIDLVEAVGEERANTTKAPGL
jgi:FHS family L-fucose permease-like MFS transporter